MNIRFISLVSHSTVTRSLITMWQQPSTLFLFTSEICNCLFCVNSFNMAWDIKGCRLYFELDVSFPVCTPVLRCKREVLVEYSVWLTLPTCTGESSCHYSPDIDLGASSCTPPPSHTVNS